MENQYFCTSVEYGKSLIMFPPCPLEQCQVQALELVLKTADKRVFRNRAKAKIFASLNLLFRSLRYPCQKAQPIMKSTVKKHSAAKNTTVTAMPTAFLRVSKPRSMNMGNIVIM